jgi:hypothetical protein
MQKEWKNHRGETVPAQYVSKFDKKKEVVVARIAKRAEELNKALKAFKEAAITDTDMLYQLMFTERNMEPKGKGNATFFSFDKELKVEVVMDEIVDFDDKITLAQAKIQEFLEEKTKGADNDLVLLVNNAFTTTKGRLDKTRVFSLFSLKITHPKWVEAIDLIKASIAVNNRRKYINISRRDSNDKYVPIQLNWSAL